MKEIEKDREDLAKFFEKENNWEKGIRVLRFLDQTAVIFPCGYEMDEDEKGEFIRIIGGKLNGEALSIETLYPHEFNCCITSKDSNQINFEHI